VNQRRDSGDEQAHGDREGVDEHRGRHVQRPDRDPREEVDRHFARRVVDEHEESDDREHEAGGDDARSDDADLLFAHVAPEEEHTRKPKSASAVAGLRRSPSQPFISESSSTEVDERRRKTATTMPRPTVTSAAATTITKKTIA